MSAAPRRAWRWGAVAAVAATITVGSTLPERSIHHVVDPVVRSLRPEAGPGVLGSWRRAAKNVAHVVEYALLAAALATAMRPLGSGPRLRILLIALVLATCYGASDELYQSVRPGRTARVSDWTLDFAGACAGLTLLTAGRRWGRAADQAARGGGWRDHRTP